MLLHQYSKPYRLTASCSAFEVLHLISLSNWEQRSNSVEVFEADLGRVVKVDEAQAVSFAGVCTLAALFMITV